jgi:spermidine synthase
MSKSISVSPAVLSCLLLVAGLGNDSASASVVFESTSPYHHIRVVDQNGVRTLSFDQSQESRMSLANPLTGHFQYTEFFHTPWLFNPEMKNVLMIGLGGGSIQRAYQHYYPDVTLDTVELDPTVVQIAKKYFLVNESPTFRVHVSDGRLYLRRTEKKYDAIIMDAYKWSRYGSFIPYHLVTKEFFELARDHLTEDGVVAYNVIGTLQGWRGDILGAVYKTMKSVFPQVYLFPATDSWNIVMVASKKPEPLTLPILQPRVAELIARGRATLPTFRARVNAFLAIVPPSSLKAPVLTDDHAPVDGLLSRVPSAAARRPPNNGGLSNAPPSQPAQTDEPKTP